MRGWGEFQKIVTKPRFGRKRWKSGRSVTLQSFKVIGDCCADVSISWDIPESVVDYCSGSVTMISDFVGYLQTDWSLKSSGVTSYMNAQGHLLGFHRSYSDLTKIHSSVFIPSEINIQRVKRFLSRKMKCDWREVLSVDYLSSINCWAKLEELQKFIPYHSKKYKQIILNASAPFSSIAVHNLSFATSIIVAALCLMVNNSRLMTTNFWQCRW